jgi:hypothetical protein
MELTIRISTDGAAFKPQAEDTLDEYVLADEVKAVLSYAVYGIYNGQTSGTLPDSNGNTCGEWSLTTDDLPACTDGECHGECGDDACIGE